MRRGAVGRTSRSPRATIGSSGARQSWDAWAASLAARALGLAGWVRNRRDGSVEALAAGEAEALDRFVQACRQGPPHAAVTAVRIEAAQDDGATGFQQRETA